MNEEMRELLGSASLALGILVVVLDLILLGLGAYSRPLCPCSSGPPGVTVTCSCPGITGNPLELGVLEFLVPLVVGIGLLGAAVVLRRQNSYPLTTILRKEDS